jgi:hemolysin activation/secretion protein
MAPGNYVADTQPYGSGEFSQAGFRVGLYKDSRIRAKDAYSGTLIDLSATAYPAALDVASPFEVYALNTHAYYTFPVIKRPFMSLKAGGQVVRGVFPFQEAAFIGGKPSERDIPRERYAGDQSLYGSAELRVPLFGFAYVLPFDFGTYIYADAGRVYLNGESPGGWHHSTGAGIWIGILNPFSGVSVDLGNEIGRNIVQAKIGFQF